MGRSACSLFAGNIGLSSLNSKIEAKYSCVISFHGMHSTAGTGGSTADIFS
jgi:hypothetical protein